MTSLKPGDKKCPAKESGLLRDVVEKQGLIGCTHTVAG